ncbi:unnamed protein product [Scytosiphon promiscuus]
MVGSVVWEPSTRKEAAYYDKLFGVVDRDKTSTLDGKETVQFLSLSGLSKTQLKNVWSVAISPGQAVLQRQDFYVAMRAVALAQNGEVTISRERIRATATDSIGVSTFKGMPAPPFKFSKGKKPQQQEAKGSSRKDESKRSSKEKATTNADGIARIPVIKRAPKDTAKKVDTVNVRKKGPASDAPSACTGDDDNSRGVKASEKGQDKGLVDDARKKSTPSKNIKRGSSSGGSSSPSSSGVASDSDDTEDDTDCSRGDETDDRDDRDDESGRDKIGSSNSRSGSDDGGSSDGGSGDVGRVERKGRNGDNNTEESKRSGSSRTSRSSSSLADSSPQSSDDDNEKSASVIKSEKMTDAEGNRRGLDSECPRSSSGSSSSSSSTSCHGEDEGPDPFSMSVKALARYQAIFSKVDAAGTGSLGGKQVIGLFAKAGLDKTVLATIWRLSDLDEDGSLSLQEFGIAFHLIFCATQRGLNVPDELPESLWPAGYVPPSVLARRKAEAEQKANEKEEEKRRCRKGLEAKQADTAGEASSDAAAEDAYFVTTDRLEAGGSHVVDGDACCCFCYTWSVRRISQLFSTLIFVHIQPLNAAEGTVGTSALPAGDAPSTAAAPTPCAAVEAAVKPRKHESAKEVNDPAATASTRADANDSLSPVSGMALVETTKPSPAPARADPSGVVDASDAESDGNGMEIRATGRPAAVVPPLTMAERRARKAQARAARIEAALLKKEAAARDARLEELDLQDNSKKFMMNPMTTSQDSGALHMLSDLGEEEGKADGSGVSSFASLSASLPHLTPYPGRPPGLRLQEFSVSFPSGIRRASALTSSLGLRLGPPKIPLGQTTNDGDSNGGGNGTSEDDFLRCPECANFLTGVQMVQHIRSTCRLLPCALCACLLLPAERERHFEETCPNRRRSCARCGEGVILSEFARHEKEGGCARRTVPCAACGEYCSADDLREHQERACRERDVRCSSCGDVLPAKCMDEHASSLCRSITWTCGCGEGPFPVSSRSSHLKSCDAFIDAWEASIEKVVMISTRVEDPGIVLLALAECGGNAPLAARKVVDDRAYVKELCLAAGIVNVGLFLRVLKKPGNRRSGALWRAGL